MLGARTHRLRRGRRLRRLRTTTAAQSATTIRSACRRVAPLPSNSDFVAKTIALGAIPVLTHPNGPVTQFDTSIRIRRPSRCTTTTTRSRTTARPRAWPAAGRTEPLHRRDARGLGPRAPDQVAAHLGHRGQRLGFGVDAARIVVDPVLAPDHHRESRSRQDAGAGLPAYDLADLHGRVRGPARSSRWSRTTRSRPRIRP